MTADCIFCKIVNKELNADLVYEDSEIVAFNDINPAAPVHILVVPRRHVQSLLDLEKKDVELIGRLHLIATDLARSNNLDETGFRIVINTGKDAGQVVFHLHLHLLGGGPLLQTIA